MRTPSAILEADWLSAATNWREHQAGIDLLYADPPFNTGRTRAAAVNGRRRARDTSARFADSFPSPAAYIAWLRERLAATIPLIKPTGSLLLHVDWRTSHHVRLLLDDLLGPDRFINHLI